MIARVLSEDSAEAESTSGVSLVSVGFIVLSSIVGLSLSGRVLP